MKVTAPTRFWFSGVCLLLAALIVTPDSAFAQREEVRIRDIAVGTVKTPDFSVSGFSKRSPRSSDWLEIEVSFDVDIQSNFVEGDLVLKYYVYAKDADKILVGEVTHVNVAKGREKLSVMYVSPNSLARLLDGKSFNISQMNPVGVQILFNGQLLTESSTRGAPDGQWWTTRPNVDGILVNKSQTPFAPLVWERYEELKPAAR